MSRAHGHFRHGAPPIKLPVGWTLLALAAGLGLGWLLSGEPPSAVAGSIAGPIGTL